MKTKGTIDGRAVQEHVLESADAAVHVLSWGAIIHDWRLDVAGSALPMVLGYPDVEAYPQHARNFGVIAGRVANRTAKGRFALDGNTYQLPINNGPNHLHGGPEGLGKSHWEMEPDSNSAVLLSHTSPEGHMGYPGTVRFEVLIRLEGAKLIWEMSAQADRPTPINLAQHNYYTLGARTGIRHCPVRIAASHYTPVDDVQIPTGEIAPVEGTRFAFRTARSVAEADPAGGVFDHNFVLDQGDGPKVEATNPETGVSLKLWTDEPGLQFFDAQHFDLPLPGHEGIKMSGWPGMCFEPQHYPDSLNKPDWPSIIYGPERPYHQRLEVEITAE
ncbi:MAG: aldose epimerase family protein [Pseudomonadota bacterium]